MPSHSYGQVIMHHPHEVLSCDTTGFRKIFLAGTIDMGSSVDWQQNLVGYFKNKGGRWLLYNPRQEHWNGSKSGEMDYQVNWELSHLEESDFIIMNILGTSKSPISLLELGLFAHSKKIAVVCDSTFYRYDNVRITCKRYGIPLYKTLDELLANEIKWYFQIADNRFN